MNEENHEPNQFITFKLGDEVFAINVSQVREVLELSEITRVPTAPDYMRGVVNVRGAAIPVVDLRLKFGLEVVPNTVNSRIIVMELAVGEEKCILGGIADSVHEVVELDQSSVTPPPSIAMRWRSEFISGMGKRGEQFVILLDIDTVFSSDDVALVDPSNATRDSEATV